jgi:predicted transcriptional regulator
MVQLADWCSAERGRQQEIANLFGVKRSAVSNWLSGRAVPSLRIGLGIQAFLARERHRR